MKKNPPKNKFSKKKGLPPGNLDFHGEILTENSSIELIDYSKTDYKKVISPNSQEIFSAINSSNNQWINVVGLHNVEHIKAIGEKYNIHHLVLEDILNTDHRPKAEKQDGYIFFIAKMFCSSETEGSHFEQISIILGKDFVLTFQEKDGDVFDALRERLSNEESKLRQSNIDYLFYRMIDSIVDSYYYTLEKISDRIESLEDEIHDNPTKNDHKSIQALKRELILLRKSVYPLREAIGKLNKEEDGLISKDTNLYLSDVYDHCIQIIDSIETFRDLTSSLMDLYMTSMSNRMNEVMKVLTIISTIFIPITFIAGVYGMNFQHMPELTHKWGYPIALTVMGLLVVIMIVYFKVKKWF